MTPAKYNQIVKRFWALWAVILVIGAGTACKRSIDDPELVRQGVIDYLSKRSNLNVSGMNVVVASVSFQKNRADAEVAFTAKGSNPGRPMSMRYTLERQGDRWVVKDKAEAGHNPHGAGAPPPAGADLPPGHPAVGGQSNP
jgi:hypothetical protein